MALKSKPAVTAASAKSGKTNNNGHTNGPSSEEILKVGLPFTPDYLHELLSTFNPIASDFQEDMQEFLIFLLDLMHSELLRGILL